MILIAIIFSSGYLLLLIWFVYGWLRLKVPLKISLFPETGFSVIIPARNEANNIIQTIKDLASQNYPAALFEVIILDDDSDDQTFTLAQELIIGLQNKSLNFKLIKLNIDKNLTAGHKKRAIESGISQSKYDWIVSTDADCTRGSNWLQSIAAIISQQDPVLVSAPVLFYKESCFFHKIQSLEFLSLVGMGAAAIGNGSPNLCNGANLAYKKSAFYEVGGFDDNSGLSSGDDEFLMHKIARMYPHKIVFLKDKDAFVFTKPQSTFRDFIQQRKRWVSKSTRYKKKDVFAILLFVYVFHLLILVTGITSLISIFFLIPFIILIGTKIIAELLLVLPLAVYFRKLRYMYLYPIAAILYVVYVVCIGIIGNSGKYLWKGRKVS
jgi:cellulose synthase/poly-beta-1,6-N-acetylglucosamine synthase-like glycosyltransferase